ncbi:MAG: cytochrome c oxidase assembly protein [Acidiferrobacterales bacterium]
MSREIEFKYANRRTMRKLFFMAVAMFGFGYALVPLYDVFCELTGINGKTRRGTIEQAAKVDTSRWITVEFTGHTNSSLAWEFRPLQSKMRVHPGQVVIAKYIARNISGVLVTGRAIPSVSPSRAAKHFKKIECFCFTEQTLRAGEEKEMPVQFYVDTKVPEEVDTITLSYAFSKVSKAQSAVIDGGKPVTVSGHLVSGQSAVPDA